jgi:hypothetical protein
MHNVEVKQCQITTKSPSQKATVAKREACHVAPKQIKGFEYHI